MGQVHANVSVSPTSTVTPPNTTRLRTWKERLQVPAEEGYANDALTNRDIIPFGEDRRTWTPSAYVMYWVIEACSITGYTTGSSLVGFGLSVKQAILCSFGAGAIYGLCAALMGVIGSFHHIGYPVIARMVYGIRGSKFGIIMRIFTGCIWWGVQAYYGAQAVTVMLSCLVPALLSWDTFHNENDITSAHLIGLVVYCAFMLPCLFIKPENLHWFFRVVTVFILGAFFGMLGYCVHLGHGAGALFSSPSKQFPSNGALAWACIQGIFSIIGSAGTGILGQSDFTRYSSTKYGPMYAQIIGAPSALVFSCVIGSITTSAAHEFIGGPVTWNPIVLLAQILEYNGFSSAARAAVFFTSASFVSQQLAMNLLLNSLSSSMDMTGLCPRYINIRRGTFIIMTIGVLIWPWKILTSAKGVVVFGSGWGCFGSAQTGLIIVKYFIIYKRKILLKDLYINNSESIYWFWHGVDWRAIVSFVVGMVFMIPGLAFDTMGESRGGWTYIYKVSYAAGIVISVCCQVVLELVFPSKTVQPTTKVDDVYNVDGSRVGEYAGRSRSTMVSVELVTFPDSSKGLKRPKVLELPPCRV